MQKRLLKIMRLRIARAFKGETGKKMQIRLKHEMELLARRGRLNNMLYQAMHGRGLR